MYLYTYVYQWFKRIKIYIYVPGADPGGAAPDPPRPLYKKWLAWLDWPSLDINNVILTLCSFDSSLHCNEYSYMFLLPRSGSCKNRHRLHFTFCNHGCRVWWTTTKPSESSKAAWFFSSLSHLLEKEGIYLV
jgi:hypothetical protein